MADITITNNNNPLNVFQPRFYVNLLEYASLLGEDIHPVHFYQNTEEFSFSSIEIPLMRDLEYDFIMLKSSNLSEILQFHPYPRTGNSGGNMTGFQNIINGSTISDTFWEFENNGLSIMKFDNLIDRDSIFISSAGDELMKFTNIIVGKIYDPPHAVDMSVKQGFDYSGVKNVYNKYGYNHTNVSWFKNPNSLFDKKNTHKKTGRRTFDLSFSYLNEADTFPDDLSNIDGHISDTNDSDIYGALFQKVFNAIPFIFEQKTEIDGTGINGENPTYEHMHRNFTLCKFTNKSFTLTQQAPFLYSTKLKLVEVW